MIPRAILLLACVAAVAHAQWAKMEDLETLKDQTMQLAKENNMLIKRVAELESKMTNST